MEVFEIVIGLLLAGAALTALAQRIGTPYPALVALAGAALALVPGTPTLVLDPELALTLFVAPVLLDAAFDASLRDLRDNWRNVAGLAIGAVLLTIGVVAAVARWLVPDMPWSVAVALGAIVAPPDAAAATAVLKQLRPPQRLLVILEGESLFNDASALLIYRLAVGIAVAGTVSPMRAVPMLLGVIVGSLVLGLGLSRVILRLTAGIQDVAIAVVVQFCGTFAVWMLAERLHLSGILTVVVFAMAISRPAATTTPARVRIPSFAVWEFAVFVLNVLAFILVGFQLKGIIGRIEGPTLVRYAAVAGAICVATILSRLAWVTGALAVGRWRYRRASGPHAAGSAEAGPPSARAAAIVGWCGMRGIVTLAAALALPVGGATGPAFPYRDLILFTSFAVVLGTLVIQGVTLRPLMKLLKLENDGSVDREVRVARIETLRAALTATSAMPGEEMADVLRCRYEMMLRRAEAELSGPTGTNGSDDATSAADAAVVRKVTAAERQRLVAMRGNGAIGDAAFQRVEQELDLEELDLLTLARDTGPQE